MKLHEFPRHPLTFGPSPVHPLDRLADHLGGARIWAKREDVNSGLAFGGSKTRKLEYIVPDALKSGADTLVSIGGVQSNHTRQVAAVAAHLGLKCRLVQERWVDWDDPVNDKVGNILLSRIMGAEVRLDPAGFDVGVRQSWREAIAEVEAAGGKPYGIPAGASEHPLGGLGFANWAFEVAEQERQLGVFFDTIIVCTVTGSTHAGMIAGFAALEDSGGGRPRRVLGIDASAVVDKTRAQVERIARHTAALIELGRDLRPDEITVLGRRLLRDPRRVDGRGDPALRQARGHDHRSGLRRQVDGRAHRPRHLWRDRRRLHGALRAPGRAARHQCLLGGLHLKSSVRTRHDLAAVRSGLSTHQRGRLHPGLRSASGLGRAGAVGADERQHHDALANRYLGGMTV
jgi:1-aminocyclopropane-1-carboxylate deaminase